MRCFNHTYPYYNKKSLIIIATLLLFWLNGDESYAICNNGNNVLDTSAITYEVSGLLIEKGVKRKKSNFLGFTIIAYEVIEDDKGHLLLKVFSEKQRVTTGDKGNFTFKLSSDKRYLLKCVKPGYLSDEIPLPKRKIASGQHISLEIIIKKAKTAVIAGHVYDSSDGSTVSEATVKLVNENSKISRLIVTDNTGTYSFEILEGEKYNIVAGKETFFESEPLSIGYEQVNKGIIKKDFTLKQKGIGKIYRLAGFHFDVNEYEITKKQAEALIEAVEIINSNPDYKFEVACFSDARGDDEYNLNLTKVRAQSIVNFLIEEHNIMPERIVSKGYGETRLINECANGVYCTTEKHEENRRIELRIIKIIE